MLFWIVVIIFIIYYVSKQKKALEEQQKKRQETAYPTYEPGAYTAPESPAKRTVTSADRARLEQYRAAKSAKAGAGQRQGQPKEKSSDILTRAKQNTKKYENDTTLEELEQEHHHTEHVAEAVSKESLKQAKAEHPHDAAHVSEVIGEESASIMPALEDLMIKGYDGKLPFERDFVGEGMDMINRFTVPDTIQVRQE